jgi:aerobic carbon-monoxide dehydrogenase medium subunit
MIPAAFTYHAPRTVDEATALLGKLGDEGKILSGGQSLIPMMKLRLASPAHIVDINGIPGLSTLEEADGHLRIGALVRESDLENSALIRSKYPLLHDATCFIADPLVRNLATVAGNLAHGDPANDHPAAMLALGATIVTRGQRGSREIPIGEFFTGLYATALEPDELLTAIKVPAPSARSGGAYGKFERKVGDFATVGVAVQLTLGASGACERVGIALTNVGPVPIHAVGAEAVLRGQPITEATIKEAARVASTEAEPSADWRGTVAYKRDLVRVLTTRAIVKARQRATGR